jgi:predicted nucleic acid-binding protein
VRYLLDVNVLVGWGWADHVDHARVVRWIAAMKESNDASLLTSSIPELGFVRVSVQRTAGRVSVAEAAETLAGMLKSLGGHHLFLPDDRPGTDLPDWCHTASRTTDAHLLTLAEAHSARLTTLDEAIPDALLIPR